MFPVPLTRHNRWSARLLPAWKHFFTHFKISLPLLHFCAFFLVLALSTSAIGAAEQEPGPNGHRFILVPAGEYAVGAPGNAVNPKRKVTLTAFRIADAETTNAQFAEFVKKTGYVSDAEKTGFGKVCLEGMVDWQWEQVEGASWRWPRGRKGPAASTLPDHPVTQISGHDAEAYCQWLGARLPTLDEWEVAARAGQTALYPWGKAYQDKRANIWNGDSHRENARTDGHVYTSPVRFFPPNAWGLHDVIGNVFEYCSGFPLGYQERRKAGMISARGGSWWCSAGTCSFYNLVDIGSMVSRGSLGNQGFRVARN